MSPTPAAHPDADVARYALRLGDDALVLCQRLAEWSSWAPEMEEDVALTNLALDQLGAARSLLAYAGQADGSGRGEDEFAYLRDDREFRNCLLVELPNAGPLAPPGTAGDFAVTMVRLLLFGEYQRLTYEWLVGSTDETLAGIAAKAAKETAYLVDHAREWTLRLGDGTEESHRRTQTALDELWPYTHELFIDDEVTLRLSLAGAASRPSSLHPQWTDLVRPVLARATLRQPADGWAPIGGRDGRHTEHLSYLLGEMQVLHRAHPGARW
jgi:ring-1,2-phenylacetyl-CoA epoxidase subunit PaaC